MFETTLRATCLLSLGCFSLEIEEFQPIDSINQRFLVGWSFFQELCLVVVVLEKSFLLTGLSFLLVTVKADIFHAAAFFFPVVFVFGYWWSQGPGNPGTDIVTNRLG